MAMIHAEHLRKADESYAIRHDNKGNAVHEYRKDGYYIIFPTLDDFARYVYLGDESAERFYIEEQDLNELYESDVYEYHALRSLANMIEGRRKEELYTIITLPKSQSALLVNAAKSLRYSLSHFDEANHHDRFDLTTLEALMHYEVSIKISKRDLDKFTSTHGVDFPEYN
jgi:hypothetical protein